MEFIYGIIWNLYMEFIWNLYMEFMELYGIYIYTQAVSHSSAKGEAMDKSQILKTKTQHKAQTIIK